MHKTLLIGLISSFFSILSCQNEIHKTNKDKTNMSIKADLTETTVGQFRKFVLDQNYITTADSFQWSGYFDTIRNEWSIKENANWEKHNGINIAADNLPAVHISYRDACDYCEWKGGRLPTAKEWDTIAGDSIILGNVWQGLFPHVDQGIDGYKTIAAPVGSFDPNLNGYFDMFGNVWEWTSTLDVHGQRIIKGGSFLCDYNVCQGYIPSRFQTTADDSGLNHLGIRCVYDIEKTNTE